jgi:glycosyltransferase involved in cell wall biosynthesis
MEIIHIVLGKANPDRLNGVNKVVYQLASNQSKHSINVSIWGITKQLTVNFKERNFETRLFKKSINPFYAKQSLKSDILSKRGIAVFHIHGGWIPVFTALAIFMKKHQIPFVYTPHGAYNKIAMLKSSFLKKIYFTFFEKMIIKNAKYIHCIGESEVKGINEIYRTNKTFLLPYGFDMEVTKDVLTKKGKSFIIGFVGRLEIYTKGLDLLLVAFKDFQQAHPNSTLWLIGDGPQKTILQEMITKLGYNDKVIFFGSKFGKEKEELINGMDVFVHPSRNEGLPTAVLEAAQFGVPCIVSEATNLGSFVKQHQSGIVIENESAASLRIALNNMQRHWNNNTLHLYKINAKKMVNDSFSWNHLIAEFSNIYELAK